jgi:glycosyltransferase involved in cell wall biosynthesis
MGERLRIGLHVGQLLQPVPGGIGRVTEMLCHELPRHASVVAFAGGPRSARRTVAFRAGASVEFRRLLMPSPSCQYELWHRTRRPKLRLDVDVVHAPSLAIPPCACPLVVSINDVAFLRHPDAFTPHGVRFHRRGMEIARREAAAVIVPSRFTRDELVAEGFDSTRIHHVPLALPNASRDSSTHEDTGVARSAPYIFAPGTVEPRKDHASLLAAFARARARRPTLSLIIGGCP